MYFLQKLTILQNIKTSDKKKIFSINLLAITFLLIVEYILIKFIS